MRLLGALLGALLCGLAPAVQAACPPPAPVNRLGGSGSPFVTPSVTRMSEQTSDAVNITGGCIDGPQLTVGGGLLLWFGGSTSAFPALKRSGTGIHVRLADDSGYASMVMDYLTTNHRIQAAGTEFNQFEIVNGGQTWQLNNADSGQAFYIYDGTNNKQPFTIAKNATATVSMSGAVTTITGLKATTITATSLLVSATAPTIASGGCSTGSAQSISANNGTAAFEITLGGATCGSTITLTMPAATTNWVCDAHNVTTPASNVLDMTGAVSTTAVVLTNYVRTTGIAGNFTGAEKLAVKCSAY